MRSILCTWILILPPRVPSSATERNNYSVKYIPDWERIDILAAVNQKLDSAIHWITQLVLLVFIRWIVIYPVDSAIHRLNNWGLIDIHFYWPLDHDHQILLRQGKDTR